MSMLSIPSCKTDDPNYRYKMPRLIAKVEGRGNGIRTNIVNMGDIARALKRPPDYPTKFCGHELGAQSKFDPAEGKAIVNGAHTQQDLQGLIDKFIDKFVLCENCKLPEIDLLIKKNNVGYRCNACGNQGLVDNRHKLATFILKNPPDGGDSTLGSKKKKSKSERSKEKSSKSKSAGKTADEDEDNEAVPVDDDDKKAKKLKKLKKAKKTSSKSKEKTREADSNDEDSDAEEPPAEGKVSKRATRGHSATGGSSSGGDDERCSENDVVDDAPANDKKAAKKSGKKDSAVSSKDELGYDSPEVKNVIERLSLFFASREATEETSATSKSPTDDATASSGTSSTAPSLSSSATALSPTRFFNQLRLFQMSQDFNHRVKLFIALEVLFSSALGGLTLQSLDDKMPFLQEVTQGMSERDVLTVFEDFVALRISGPLAPGFINFPYILQKLYNSEIIDEDGIIKHYSNPAKTDRQSYVVARAAAKPFLDWLREDASESDTDTDEGLTPHTNRGPIAAIPVKSQLAPVSVKRTDEENHGAATQPSVQPSGFQVSSFANKAEPDQNSDDDIDIDAI